MGGSASTQCAEIYWDFETTSHGTCCHHSVDSIPAHPCQRPRKSPPVRSAPSSMKGAPHCCTSWRPRVPPCQRKVDTSDISCSAAIPDKHCYKYTADVQVACPGRHFVTTALDPNTFAKDAEKEREFLKIVATSVVGFLNTGEGGVISAGVTDLGFPLGFALTAEQMERVTWMIERCVEEIQPSVSKDLYSVTFEHIFGVPFAIQPYTHTNQELRVIEITVRPIMAVKHLHTWRGVPYMRRDGGTYKMTAAEVDWFCKMKQDWRTAQMRKELEKLRGHLTLIQKGLKDSLEITSGSHICQANLHPEVKPHRHRTGCTC